ncbi:polysaccharide deacetylase family protein [Teredinibacter purpureus]|uniref:polysaccharide deacetylase family protein n=1 Tax=Teredinibacter purpureus TaxID=2731756 RepID=UPI0005F79E69|nr:polysaccharide deacetylase family protein [Teredinibacter purpureus]
MKSLAGIGFVLLSLLSGIVFAEEDYPFEWPRQAKAAVVLTYDDTLNSHLDIAAPQLVKAGLTGTFYISGGRGDIQGRMSEWRALAAGGHELGNHTLYHPCRKSMPGREWVSAHLDMDIYTVEQYAAELNVTNSLLQAIDGEARRTFAYTCGDETVVNNASVVEVIKPLVIAARAVTPDGFNDPRAMDFYHIHSVDVAGKTGEELIALAEQAKVSNRLMVYLFHGVGADYLSVESKAHQALVSYLSSHNDDYWVTTLKDAVDYLRP